MKNLILVSALSAVALLAQPSSEVQFSDCTEYIGAGWVPLSQAAPFVPSAFQLFTNGLQALLVTRAADCQSVVIDNARPEAARISQIGVSVLSPDGIGDINNYTVDEDLAYEVNAGNLFVDVSPEDGPAYFFHGAVTILLPVAAFRFWPIGGTRASAVV